MKAALLVLFALGLQAKRPSTRLQNTAQRVGSTTVLQIRFRDGATTTSQLLGRTPGEIASKLNRYVEEHDSVQQVLPCSSLNPLEVVALRDALMSQQDGRIAAQLPQEDGRQLAMPAAMNALPRTVGEQAALRDALCAETVKLWAHHLPEAAKARGPNFTLPSLPVFNNSEWRVDTNSRYYNKSFTCVNGHSAPTADQNETWVGWPFWPLTGHFKGKGHGPFPFWHFGTNYALHNAMKLNVSLERPYLYHPGNPVEVWYDMAVRRTKFYHSKCDWILLDINGLSGEPCIHMMTHDNGDGKWYVFTANRTTKRADGRFCCDDTFSGLGTMNPRFMEGMWYYGEVDFKGDYYTGRAKRYQTRLKTVERVQAEESIDWQVGHPEQLKHPSLPLDVWYETDLEDRPLRFVEADSVDIDNVDTIYRKGGYLTSDDLPLLYTEYDRSSWEADAVPEGELDLPAICENTSNWCGVPPWTVSAEESASWSKEERWPACAFDFCGDGTVEMHQWVSSHWICDVEEERLVHAATESYAPVRPMEGCHTYAFLAPVNGTADDLVVGVRSKHCADLQPEDVVHSIAVDAATCTSIGSVCPSEPALHGIEKGL